MTFVMDAMNLDVVLPLYILTSANMTTMSGRNHTNAARYFVVPSSTYLFTVAVEGFYFHLMALKHTPQSVGLLWTRDRPVPETCIWQHTTTHKRQTSMPLVRFEPTIPASARPQASALDRAATGIGCLI
jgi:hypothetical protein